MSNWQFKTVLEYGRSWLAWPEDRPWWRWKRCWLAFCFVLYLFIGSFVVPWWIEGRIVQGIEQHTELDVARAPEVSLNPLTFSFSLERGDVQYNGKKFVSFRSIAGDFELLSSLFYWRPTLDWIVVRSPHFHLQLNESGETNFHSLMRENAGDSGPRSSLGLFLNQFNIRGGRVAWNDRRTLPPVDMTTSQLEVSLRSIEWPPRDPWPVELRGEVGETGQFRIDGSVHAGRGDARLDVTVEQIPLSVSNDYLERYLSGRWDTGSVSLDGQLVKRTEPGTFQFRSDFNLRNPRLHETGGTTVISVEQFGADTVAVDVGDRAVRLEDIFVNEPYLRLDFRNGYRTNFSTMLKTDSAGTTTDESPPGVDLGEWTVGAGPTKIRSGQAIVHDANVPEGFTAGYHDISGTVARLQMAGTAPASVALRAQSNRGAELSVNGRVLASAPTRQSSLVLEYRNGPMVPLSPYSVRFVGHRIDQGKMSLDLDYDLLDRVLEGSNHLVLDQFQLGRKVNDQPELSVPIGLAVALLKNDEGMIDLDIPVTGNLDSPTFNLGGTIRQAVNNTIGSIVSSPFRFLAGLVPGDPPDLSVVKYSPGQLSPLDREIESIEGLAIALEKRPQLSLEIRPVWSTADRNHLARNRVNRMLSEAGADTTALQGSLVTLETVFVRELSQDRLREIKTAHTTPNSNEPGQSLDRVGYSEALYEGLIRGVEVPSKQLNEIADSRARGLVKRLTDKGIAGDRLFVLDVNNLSATTTPVELPLSLRAR